MTVDHLYSDPHFGHGNVIKYCNRPFADVAEMNAELIRRYNETVGEHDVVLWLGDCFLGPIEFAQETLAQLNGRKLLVRGNHDGGLARMARIGFDIVTDSLTMHIAGRIVRVAHRPPKGVPSLEPEVAHEDGANDVPVPRRDQGVVYMHGHVHMPYRVQNNRVHVGVDAWDYRPASYAEVEALIAAMPGGT